MNSKAGTLYVVATPIGNLQDVSARALDVLSSVDLILAEDTRHAKVLLDHYGIGTSTRSLHEHNERNQIDHILQTIADGADVAIISDAGTPLISDPGFPVVRAGRRAGVSILPVPGPVAAIAAISVSGIATDRFCFEGFLPQKSAARRQALEKLMAETRTMVFYESARRLCPMLTTISEVFGSDRICCVCREMTKRFETHYFGPVAEVCKSLSENPDSLKGECVVVIAGSQNITTDLATQQHTMRVLMQEMSLKQASSVGARLLAVNKNALYQIGLELRDSVTESEKT
ncbi:MAG: 16S rRNA (cytidine(1402)-2'-O)-methyltransferase [Pseudomonadota bacterium]